MTFSRRPTRAAIGSAAIHGHLRGIDCRRGGHKGAGFAKGGVAGVRAAAFKGSLASDNVPVANGDDAAGATLVCPVLKPLMPLASAATGLPTGVCVQL
jgi:hypothetical protein